MTRLEAIELLLDELKRYDPAQFQQVMCTVLNVLGYADRVEEAADLLVDRHPDDRTLH
jgi:restriction endonuclease Mrr